MRLIATGQVSDQSDYSKAKQTVKSLLLFISVDFLKNSADKLLPKG